MLLWDSIRFQVCLSICLSVCLQGLHLLDPSGVVLEQVCDPVRAYLRTREDTVRCIVASLTDDSSNELADVSCVCIRGSFRKIPEGGQKHSRRHFFFGGGGGGRMPTPTPPPLNEALYMCMCVCCLGSQPTSFCSTDRFQYPGADTESDRCCGRKWVGSRDLV